MCPSSLYFKRPGTSRIFSVDTRSLSKLLDCKRSCRQLERRWRRSRSGYDRSKYRNNRNLCNRLMTEAKSQCFSNLIDENSENPRRLNWDTINNILHRTPAAALPDSDNVKSLCQHFAKYSCDKIITIRANFQIRRMMYHLFRSLK